jgi:CubicO group peptidase (beta-lactamase class C family)
MHRRRLRLAATGLVLALVCALSAPAGSSPNVSPTNAATVPTPGRTWTRATPASVGLDGTKLAAIARRAEQGNSNCFLVARGGKLAGEAYFRGTKAASTQDVFSVTKSVTSTLVGIAQDDGDLRITDSASKWITEWKGTPAEAVTVRDLLSNDSGREWSPIIDYVQFLLQPDRTAFAVHLGQTTPPGQVWAYNNSAIQTLQRVLAKATGEDVVSYARRRLFAPLGMTHTSMTRDRAGNAQTFEGVYSTCRDLARFGVLMLNRGRWGDRQIVSAQWVAEATGKSSTPLNAAYGYLWWVNRPGVIANASAAVSLQDVNGSGVRTGKMVPAAPDDTFWALGLGNQVVQVDPGSRTVVVRLGTPVVRSGEPSFGAADAATVLTEAVTAR